MPTFIYIILCDRIAKKGLIHASTFSTLQRGITQPVVKLEL